jgi:hypothetical protein
MGAVESLDALCLAIGLPLGGALVAISSPRVAFLAVGVGATVASAALFRLSLKGVALTPNADTVASLGASPGGVDTESLPRQLASQEPAPK